jgi:beta-catenin-like protein 1
MEDVTDEGENASFAPGGDADYFAEEDDEGRFFGGGLTSEQKEILNIFDKAESVTIDEEVRNFSFSNPIFALNFRSLIMKCEEMDMTQIRRSLVSFERAANKNQDQRSKYPNDPSKYAIYHLLQWRLFESLNFDL